jgi:hypothetical protein
MCHSIGTVDNIICGCHDFTDIHKPKQSGNIHVFSKCNLFICWRVLASGTWCYAIHWIQTDVSVEPAWSWLLHLALWGSHSGDNEEYYVFSELYVIVVRLHGVASQEGNILLQKGLMIRFRHNGTAETGREAQLPPAGSFISGDMTETD